MQDCEETSTVENIQGYHKTTTKRLSASQSEMKLFILKLF